jgi:hypothetical protein
MYLHPSEIKIQTLRYMKLDMGIDSKKAQEKMVADMERFETVRDLILMHVGKVLDYLLPFYTTENR